MPAGTVTWWVPLLANCASVWAMDRTRPTMAITKTTMAITIITPPTANHAALGRGLAAETGGAFGGRYSEGGR